MIVRDAEATLERALKSVAGHVDRIVVVDTGSKDGTEAIARRYTDMLYHVGWYDDFSHARQFSYDVCDTDWIIWLDADDELLYADEIRPSLDAVGENVGALLWRYILARTDDGTILQSAWRERCTRRGWYRWEGRCHEALVPVREALFIPDESVEVLHHGSGDPHAKALRNIRILERALAEEDPIVPRTLFYLARDMLAAGDENPLPLLQQYLEVAPPLTEGDIGGQHLLAITPAVDERYYAQILLAHCYRAHGRYHDAEGADIAAIKISPQWPHAYFGLASTYYAMRRWRWVIHWCDFGKQLPEPQNITFPISAIAYDAGWRMVYAAALGQLGALTDALEVTREGLSLTPDDPTLLANEAALVAALEKR